MSQFGSFVPHDTVVELGPGTGSFTELLLQRLDKRGRLLALEINAVNISVLRRRFLPCEIIHDSAEHLQRYLGGKLQFFSILPGQCLLSPLTGKRRDTPTTREN